MRNFNSQTFTKNSSWVCPAGVTNVQVIATKSGNSPKKLANGYSPIALASGGSLYSWGYNAFGELGLGDVASRSSPVIVLGGVSFSSCYASIYNSFGLTPGGSLYGWGRNSSGELGIGSTTPQSSPVLVSGGIIFQKIALGNSGSSNLVLSTGGSVYAFGGNTNGQLGVGNTTNQNVPTPVVGVSGISFTDILFSPSNTSSYLLSSTGSVYASGQNNIGQLGVGDTTPRSSPVLVVGGYSFIKIINTVSTSNATTAALTSSGSVYTWGLGAALGNGDPTLTAVSSPVLVLGGNTFTNIFSGTSQFFGITADGTAYAWGGNANGQLGVGDVVTRSSPVLVLGGLKFQNIISGDLGDIYGLTKSGALYAWGNNVYGQLGVGDVIPRSSPVLVLGGLTWNQIFINGGSDTPIGVTTTGSFYSWGYNGNGQIGDGTTVSKSSPVLVLNTFALDNVDNSTTTSVTVVPGTTYTITLQKYNPQFGTVNVGSGVFDLITLQW